MDVPMDVSKDTIHWGLPPRTKLVFHCFWRDMDDIEVVKIIWMIEEV
jgi:hypothetical protein